MANAKISPHDAAFLAALRIKVDDPIDLAAVVPVVKTPPEPLCAVCSCRIKASEPTDYIEGQPFHESPTDCVLTARRETEAMYKADVERANWLYVEALRDAKANRKIAKGAVTVAAAAVLAALLAWAVRQ